MTITAYLKRKGLADAPLRHQAKALGISAATLWRILNKETGIALGTITKIEAATSGKVRYRDLADEASAEART